MQKKKSAGKWVTGKYGKIREWSKTDHLPISVRHLFLTENEGTRSFVEIDPDTVCSDTWLTDKNNRIIWENDICKVPDLHGGYENLVTVWNWDTVSYVLQEMNDTGKFAHFEDYRRDEIEVVENVLDLEKNSNYRNK